MATRSQNLLERIEPLSELTADAATLKAWAGRELGVSHATLLLVHPPGGEAAKPAANGLPRFVSTYPGEWIERYRRQNYLDHDPVLRRAHNARLPFLWGELIEGPPIDPAARALMWEAADFGIEMGLSAIVRGPGGERSVFTIADSASRQHDLNDPTIRNLVYMAAFHLHNRLCVDATAGHEPAELTERERECLLWTARGKTTWEIGAIIRRSESTVNFHLNNAALKLGVGNRCHATIRAFELGLIYP